MTGADALGVSCEAVSCVYPSRRGDVRALEQVSFDVRGHAFVSSVGPSGCGVEPTSPNGRARPDAGLVFQEYGTFPWMTVLENLAFGLEMAGVAASEP